MLFRGRRVAGHDGWGQYGGCVTCGTVYKMASGGLWQVTDTETAAACPTCRVYNRYDATFVSDCCRYWTITGAITAPDPVRALAIFRKLAREFAGDLLTPPQIEKLDLEPVEIVLRRKDIPRNTDSIVVRKWRR